jgi:nucleoside-diphosphate-sugar epimerase
METVKLLVLGGTAWLGREIVRQAVAAGHEVTCVARGSGEIPDGATLLKADRDQDDALAPVASGHWDAVIDVARQPGHVRRAVRDLDTDFYAFVSSASAYANHRDWRQDETAPLLPPLASDVMESMEQYGEAKVACEQAVLERFGTERSLIARAGLIAGSGDSSGRTGYWPLRFAHPSVPDGSVLVPDAASLPTAVIDLRDLAAWLVEGAKARTAGIFNTNGDVISLAEHLGIAREVAGHTGPLRVADASWLAEHRVQEWAGPRSLPLWLSDPDWSGMNARSNYRAKQAGLDLRPLSETLADTLAWELEAGADRPRGAGLTAADEAELLRELAS